MRKNVIYIEIIIKKQFKLENNENIFIYNPYYKVLLNFKLL